MKPLFKKIKNLNSLFFLIFTRFISDVLGDVRAAGAASAPDAAVRDLVPPPPMRLENLLHLTNYGRTSFFFFSFFGGYFLEPSENEERELSLYVRNKITVKLCVCFIYGHLNCFCLSANLSVSTFLNVCLSVFFRTLKCRTKLEAPSPPSPFLSPFTTTAHRKQQHTHTHTQDTHFLIFQ